MKRIANWLEQNPRKKEKIVELELLHIAIDYYHVISLLWEKTTRKHTKCFLIYKTQEILERIVDNLESKDDVKLIQHYIDTFDKQVEDVGEEDIFASIGVNFESVEWGITIHHKIAFLFKLLENRGITRDQIFAKYNI